jgi:hypothetical protein|tara:strand:+ start:1736 stop:2047 length:312 start_codon:yes stop_codon:yes gene_type:complete
MTSSKGYLQDIADDSIRKVQELVAESKRYLDALGEIATCGDQANAVYLRGIARAAIDGASTTADEHNCMIRYRDPGDENDSSANRWHDTNAQITAYDKSMEEE